METGRRTTVNCRSSVESGIELVDYERRLEALEARTLEDERIAALDRLLTPAGAMPRDRRLAGADSSYATVGSQAL